jgi:hypothetical protein
MMSRVGIIKWWHDARSEPNICDMIGTHAFKLGVLTNPSFRQVLHPIFYTDRHLQKNVTRVILFYASFSWYVSFISRCLLLKLKLVESEFTVNDQVST